MLVTIGIGLTCLLVGGVTTYLAVGGSESKTLDSAQNLENHASINNVVIKDIQDKVKVENNNKNKIVMCIYFIIQKCLKRIKSKYENNNRNTRSTVESV